VNAIRVGVGTAFLARTGLRTGGRDLSLAILVVAITAFLVTLAPLWFGHATDDALRTRLAAATEAQRGLEFELRGSLAPSPEAPLGAVEAQADALTAELPASLRGALGAPAALVDSGEFLVPDAPRPILRVGLRIEDVAEGIRFVSGRPPTGRTATVELPDHPEWGGVVVFEVALSSGTAAEVGLAVGDRIAMVPGTNRLGFLAIEVVGIFDVVDPADGRWFADPTLATAIEERVSAEVTIYHATALLAPSAYPALVGHGGGFMPVHPDLRYRWRYRLDPDRIPADKVADVMVDLARLRAAHPFGATATTPALSTGLADLMARYRADRATAGTAVALAMVGPLVAMVAALALLAVEASRRRREASHVLLARGGRMFHVVGGRTLEALTVALPAALAGGGLAAVVTGGPGTAVALAPAIATGLAATGLFMGAAAVEARRPAAGREAGRGGSSGRRRLVFDVLVVAVALGCAASLRGRDPAGVAASGASPLLAAVPVLLALAGGIVVLRVYRLAARLGARAAAARPGLPAAHGLRGAARGVAGQQVSLVALVLVVAMGVFSAIVVGTLAEGQERAAAEAVGADFRVEEHAPGGLPPPFNLQGIPAIEATAIATRTGASLLGDGRVPATVNLVVLDAPAYAAVIAGRPVDAALPAGLLAPPAPDAGTKASPVAAIVGAATMDRLRLAPGDVGTLTVRGRTVSIRAVEGRTRFPGLGSIDDAVLLDRAAAEVALAGNVGPPSVIYVRAAPATEPALAAAVARYGVVIDLETRERSLAALREGALVAAIRTGFGAALFIAFAYAALVVAVAARGSIRQRERELAVLRALGTTTGSLVTVLAVEVVPLVLIAVGAGAGLGALVAALTIPDLGLERVVGSAGSPGLAVDPALLVGLVAVPFAGAALAVAVGALAVRGGDLARATRAIDL
jgi:putative ABC transport system permease protein